MNAQNLKIVKNSYLIWNTFRWHIWKHTPYSDKQKIPVAKN